MNKQAEGPAAGSGIIGSASDIGSESLGATPLEIERIVVRRVFEGCHRYIAEGVLGATLPAEFLGALTANESGGKVNAAYFEPAVFEHLKAVASGQRPAFGSIAWKQLASALGEIESRGIREIEESLAMQERREDMLRAITGSEEQGLRDFATSWGFTQIMGYQVIGRKVDVKNLIEPQFHFHFAMEILNDFARRFGLRLSRDFESLFRCWNTGRPDGKTFDPGYVAKGMRRMNLYRELMHQAAGGQPIRSAEER